MKISILLIICLLFSCAFMDTQSLLITKSFAEQLQSQVTWKVTDYESNIFKDWTIEQAKSLFMHNISPKLFAQIFLENDQSLNFEYQNLPPDYDFRKEWPLCKTPIRDQGKCGSCWAFGSVESLGDRFCLKTKDPLILSSQEIVSCCTKAKGCGGGYLDHAFDYFEESGVVTEKCQPYESQKGNSPECYKGCKNHEEPYIKYKCKPGSSRYYGFDVEKLKAELVNNGPIAATFVVYKDFFYYKSGIYYHKTGEYVFLY